MSTSPVDPAEYLSDLQVETTAPGCVHLKITVPASKVDEAFETVLMENLEKVKLKGFRQGHAPPQVARKGVPDKALRSRVIKYLVPLAYKAAIAKLGLSPLDRGDSDVKECERGKDLIFEADLQVLPLLDIQDQDAYLPLRDGIDPESSQDREELATSIVSRLLEQVSFEVLPTQLRQGHAKLALRRREDHLRQFGVTLEAHLQQKGLTPQQFADEVALAGLVEARLEVLYRSLAKAFGLTVTSSDVEDAIRTQANSTGDSGETLRKRLKSEEGYRLFVYRLLVKKVREQLVEKSFELSFLEKGSA